MTGNKNVVHHDPVDPLSCLDVIIAPPNVN